MRLTGVEAQRRFLEAPNARMATVAADGAPRLVPVVFAFVDGTIVHVVDHKPKSTTDLARLHDIATEPRVSFLVDVYDDDWSRLWWVRADAVAEVLREGPAWQAAIGALQYRYEQYREVPPTAAVIAAAVTRWSGWSAS